MTYRQKKKQEQEYKDLFPFTLALFCLYKSSGLLLGCGQSDLSLRLLKGADLLADQVEDLAVRRASVVLGNVVELVVKLGVDLDPKMLIFLVSHKNLQKNLI